MNNVLFFLTAFLLFFGFSDSYASDQDSYVQKIENTSKAIEVNLDTRTMD